MTGTGNSSRAGARFDRDWTKGNIISNLLSLGWPMMIGSSLTMIGPTIDMIWVGKLGPAAIAGVGVSGMIVMLVNAAMMGLYQGMRAMVSRFVGAGNPREANHVVQQAFIVSFTYSIALAVIGILFAEKILILMGVGPDVISEGAIYLRINFVGMITMSMRMIGEASMQASGDAKRPMWISVFYRIFHIVLSPFLIFGLAFFPRMGVSGAATANLISQGLGATLGLWLLFSGRTRLRLTFRGFHFDGNLIWRLVKIGIPASITTMGRTFGNLILVWYLTPFGTLAVAAHSLNQRIDMFVNTPQMAFGQAAGVLAGQNLGAGQPGRAKKTGWMAAGLLSGLMLIMSVMILLWAEIVVRIFTSDPALVELASTFLRIASAGWLVMGLTSVFQQSLNGVGDTMVPMAIMVVDMWLLQILFAFVLSRHTSLGVYGVRWAMVIGPAIAAICYTIYYEKGRWLRKKI